MGKFELFTTAFLSLSLMAYPGVFDLMCQGENEDDPTIVQRFTCSSFLCSNNLIHLKSLALRFLLYMT